MAVVKHVAGSSSSASTHWKKIIPNKMGSERLSDAGEGTRISKTKAPLLSSTCLWKWGETKARLVLQYWPRLNSPHHRNRCLLTPLCLAGTFLKENPWTASILNTFYSICTAGRVMRRFRLRFRLSAECITAAEALRRPEQMTLCSLAAPSSC